MITTQRTSNAKRFQQRLAATQKKAVYVGIPSSSSRDRASELLAMAAATAGITKQAGLMRAAKQDVSNAELLYIFSKGSPLKGIPPRPVLEPAIEAEANKKIIARELAGAAKAALDGDEAKYDQQLKRAGMAAQNAAREWFTNPENGWAPNAPSTIKAKGSDTPGVDTGAMRQAIVFVVRTEE